MGRLIDIKMDEALWERVKRAAEAAGIILTVYVQSSQEDLMDTAQTAMWEQQEIAAYQKQPDQPDDVEIWLPEQAWGEI